MQNEEPKIFMSDEQFAWLKALEINRSREMLARIDEQTEILKAQEARKGDDLRDMLAGQALSGFCANPSIFQANSMSGWDLVNCTERQLADCAVRIADEMVVSLKAGVK